MGIVVFVSIVALAISGWFWNISSFSGVFFVVLAFVVQAVPIGFNQDNPRFIAVWQSICTLAATIVVITVEDTIVSYCIMFTTLVAIAFFKTMPVWDNRFFDVYVNSEPIMIEEKLYNIIDQSMSDGLRYAVVIPVVIFYCMLMAPYILAEGEEIILAFLPFVFVLYRTVRIFMMTR